MKLALTTEQTKDLPFPLGCPVWYNFPSTLEANNNASSSSDDPPILKRGVVQSVSLDILTREMLYKVVYKQNDNDKVIEDEVSDKELAFGSNCPVFISAAEEENDENNNNPSETKKNVNSGQEEGMVLYCEQSPPIGFVYTVMTFMEGSKARYEEGVTADRIKYRTVNVNTDEATKEEKRQQSTLDDRVSAVSTNDVAVPSSITLGQREDGGIVAEPNKKMKLSVEDGSSTHGSHSQKKMDMPASTGKGKGHDDTDHGTRIDITIPLFLQRDRTMQKTLFNHLLGREGSRKGMKQNGVSVIGKETYCGIRVNYDSRAPMPHDNRPLSPMTITIHANSRNGAMKNLRNARLKIQELLLDYAGHDGSRGRLVYETAVSCWGAHRPRVSNSQAVQADDPFNSGTGKFLTVLPLPYQLSSDRKKIFHAANLLLTDVQRRLTYDANCYIKLVGNEFRVPCRMCEPYVIVMGSSWKGVDKGAEIVKEVVRDHMRSCNCTL